mgnify:FL=1|tara:strand:+ start:32947 stop:33714 length:768 start_codon:yes stop_codon:yes gene_type:complete
MKIEAAQEGMIDYDGFLTSDYSECENGEESLIYNNSNIGYQTVTTLKGLEHVKTKYAIKLRCDEIYTDISPIIERIKDNPDKLVTNDVYFLPDPFVKFHPSDHIIGGTTDNMLGTFRNLKDVCTKFKDKGKDGCIFGKDLEIPELEEIAPEVLMTICFLKHKGVDINVEDSGKIMLDNFDMVSSDNLGNILVMVKGEYITSDLFVHRPDIFMIRDLKTDYLNESLFRLVSIQEAEDAGNKKIVFDDDTVLQEFFQ